MERGKASEFVPEEVAELITMFFIAGCVNQGMTLEQMGELAAAAGVEPEEGTTIQEIMRDAHVEYMENREAWDQVLAQNFQNFGKLK